MKTSGLFWAAVIGLVLWSLKGRGRVSPTPPAPTPPPLPAPSPAERIPGGGEFVSSSQTWMDTYNLYKARAISSAEALTRFTAIYQSEGQTREDAARFAQALVNSIDAERSASSGAWFA